jgi:hypothetical protein
MTIPMRRRAAAKATAMRDTVDRATAGRIIARFDALAELALLQTSAAIALGADPAEAVARGMQKLARIDAECARALQTLPLQ